MTYDLVCKQKMEDFIKTINEGDIPEIIEESSNSEDEEPKQQIKKLKKKKRLPTNTEQEFNDDFQFVDQDDEFDNWVAETAAKHKNVKSTSLDEKIAEVRRKNKKAEEVDDNEDREEIVESEESSEDETTSKIDTLRTKEKKRKKKRKKGKEDEDEEEFETEKISYGDEILDYDKNITFHDMNLSRPLLKALTTMSFKTPTPIQAATVPVALKGKDICACAATGTGKTAAFMLPILERLLYKPRQAPVTRVLVLSPTRELAVQIHTVARQLAQFTNIDVSLSAGGLDVKAQEAALRLGPDVVIATPGRLIDHLHNSVSFNLNSVEILILDEADRMLDEYFAEQMKEVIRLCSRQRQTMLFSATMTEAVNDLAAVSLKNPTKIFVNQNSEVALNLRQEFVRVRANREGDREALLTALVKRTFHEHCLVFIQTKRQAHRMHIVLGLLGVRVAELHGNLSQPQRLEALQKFKEGEIDVLLATDLAARGLDIPRVTTVINFTMPNSVAHYIHRVGRTARAGKSGRSVSLVGENERKMLKDIVKKAKNPVKSRVIPAEVVAKYKARIDSMEQDVVTIMKQEKEEKELRIAEIKFGKMEEQVMNNNVPEERRTWFQSKKERQQEKAALRLGDIKLLPSNKKTKKVMMEMAKKRVPLTPEERIEYEQRKAEEYSVRASKRDRRPKRVHTFNEDDDTGPPKKKNKKKGVPSVGRMSFAKELTSTSSKSLKKYRHGPDMSFEERKEKGLIKNVKKKGGKFKSKSKHKRR